MTPVSGRPQRLHLHGPLVTEAAVRVDSLLVLRGKSVPCEGVANLAELLPVRVTEDSGLGFLVLSEDVREGEDRVARSVAMLEVLEKIPASAER